MTGPEAAAKTDLATAPTVRADHPGTGPAGRRTVDDDGFVALDILVGVFVLAILLLTVLMSIGPHRQRSWQASAVSDARHAGEAINAQLSDHKTLADAGLPTTPTALSTADLDNLGITLTRGIAVSRYAQVSSTEFQVCLVHYSGSSIDAYALYDSHAGRVIASGRGAGPAACETAAPSTTPPPPTTTPTPTTGPEPPVPTSSPTGPPASSVLAPTNVRAAAVPGDPVATVTWDAVDGASSYAVHLDGSSTPAWTGSGLTTDLTGLAAGPHAVTVTALAGGDESPKSNAASFTIYGDNDFLRHAHPIPDRPGEEWVSRDYDNTGATVETGEPATYRHQSMWWTFTAPRKATYTLGVAQASDGSALFTYPQIVVYATDTDDVTALGTEFASTSGSTSSRLQFVTTPGTTYKVKVGAGTDSAGYKSKYRLKVATGPTNDMFGDAMPATGLAASSPYTSPAVNNTYAGAEPGEPSGSIISTWWTFTAPYSATYSARVLPETDGGTLFTFPKMYAYETTTDDVTQLPAPIVSETCCSKAVINIPAQAGKTYKVRVSGGSATLAGYQGSFRLQVVPGPANDNLANAMTVSGPAVGIPYVSPDVDNSWAGAEVGEPSSSAVSTWWTFTAPRTATYAIKMLQPTSGAALYTFPKMYAYQTETSDVTQLPAAVVSETCCSKAIINLPATAGVTYKIRITGSNGYNPAYIGAFRLQISG